MTLGTSSKPIDWAELRKSLLPEKATSILPPTVKLPVLPKALMDFSQKAKEPEIKLSELSRIIATDSGLSSELLRYVNAAKNGITSRVTSVHQALVTLGIQSTRLYLTTSGMKQVMKSTASKLINFQSFWNTNLERAIFAKELAKLLQADQDLAFTAAMLQDFLLPLITNQLIDDYLDFTEYRDEYQSLIDFERQKFGWDHAEAAATVMCGWQFPDELICCVGMHHRGTEVFRDPELQHSSAAAVAISSLMPDALRQESRGIESLLELEQEWEDFRLLPLAEKVDKEFQEVAADVENHFSLLRVVQKTLERLSQDKD